MIGAIVNRNLLELKFGERQTSLEDAQEVLKSVAQYTEPAGMVQRVCYHLPQIIALPTQITDLHSQPIRPAECDQLIFEHQLETLRPQLQVVRMTARMVVIDEDHQQELDDMTWDP